MKIVVFGLDDLYRFRFIGYIEFYFWYFGKFYFLDLDVKENKLILLKT